MEAYVQDRWKRNFWTGIFSKGNSRLVEDPHGIEETMPF